MQCINIKLLYMCSSEPVVVVEKVIGEGVKVKVVELGLTVVLSQNNKIFIKVSSLYSLARSYMHLVQCNPLIYKNRFLEGTVRKLFYRFLPLMSNTQRCKNLRTN